MASQAQLYYIVRPEYYATLTLESLISVLSNEGAGNLLQPPLPQPILDIGQGPLGNNPQKLTTLQLLQNLVQSRFSRPWMRWLADLQRFVTQGTSGSGLLEIVAPSIDETDIAWFGNGSIGASTDPVTFTATLTGQSRFGLACTITNPGTGYGSAPTVTITDANGHTNGAAVTATVSGGAVDSLTVTNNGYGLVPPLTVAFSGGGGSGATATADIGRQWSVGDYLIWNDPTITTGQYGYEIDQITAITFGSPTSATFTLARAAAAAPSGFAQYGSPKVAHSSANFYRLINKSWLMNVDPGAGPQPVMLLWPNMTVAAVTVGQQGQGSINVNLAPLPYLPGTTTPNPRLRPPSPGMRTMNGAAYTNLAFPGTLVPGQTAITRVSAQAWESVRTVYAKVFTAPAGATSFGGDANAAIVIWVCYISPPNSGGTRTVGLLDCLVIDTGTFTSYADFSAATPNVPDGRQMPYHGLSQWVRTSPLHDWPPNWLPVCAGALNASGALQLGTAPNLPAAPSGTTSVQFEPDGQIDFIVGQVGTTTAGANLVVTVQT